MIFNRSLICIFFVVFFNFIIFANEDKKPLTLQQMIHFAMENSPEFQSYQSMNKIDFLKEKIASTYLLPTLDLTASHGLQGHRPTLSTLTSTDPYFSSLGLTLTENIYDNGKSYKQYQISKLQQKLSSSQLLQNTNKFCLSIINEYLSFSLFKKLYDIQEIQNKNIRKQFNLFSNDYYHGIKTQKDFLRLKTAVNRSEIDLLNYKNSIFKAQEQLFLSIGQKSLVFKNTTFENENLMIIPFNFNNLPKDLLDTQMENENLPYLKSFDLQKQINELQEELVQKPFWPEINFSANANYSNSQYWHNNNPNSTFDNTATQSWTALLTLNWNLLDWGKQSNARQIAIETKKWNQNQIQTQQNQYQSDINLLMTKYKMSIENYNLSVDLLKMEESNMNFIEREYRNGKVMYLDYTTGLRDLADAQSKYYTSVTDLLNVIYTVKYHKGILFDEISQ